MMKLNHYKPAVLAAVLTASFGAPFAAGAAVSAEEAARLGQDLTPFGAERAGNADGSIPAWSPDPAGLDQIQQDSVSLTITANNYQQHADKLSVGLQALFEKYPDSFQMNVYPTRRTHNMPQWIYDNIKENAVEATLSSDGYGVENAFGGTPFPIPQSGEEVIWNHVLRWRGEGHDTDIGVFTIYPDGNISSSVNRVTEKYSYYEQGAEDSFNDLVGFYFQETVEPSRRAGEVLLVHEPLNQAETPRLAWQYIPGQRRVRRAPTVAYDTPYPASNGINVYDEFTHFNGGLDRYDWELVGKKELYVPYNDNRFLNAVDEGVDVKTLLPGGHPDPEYKRWELHRVWVVEATVKDGQRHVYAKRRFFIDEDSWQVLISEAYDGRGDLWKVAYTSPYYAEDLPGVVGAGYVHHDLLSGNYVVDRYVRENFSEARDDDFFTIQNVRRQARR